MLIGYPGAEDTDLIAVSGEVVATGLTVTEADTGVILADAVEIYAPMVGDPHGFSGGSAIDPAGRVIGVIDVGDSSGHVYVEPVQ